MFLNPLNYLELFWTGSGPLTDTGLATTGQTHTPANPDPETPDLMMITLPASFDIDFGTGFREAFCVRREAYDAFYADAAATGARSIMLIPTLNRPKSVGTLKLRSSKSDDPPVLKPNYLSHPQDVRTLVEGMKMAKSMEDTVAFKKHGLRIQV